MNAAVVGLGKAGLPLACVMADSGITVTGVDVDKKRVAMLKQGKNPLPEEPGLSELISANLGRRLVFVDAVREASGCSTYVVIVPLFIDERNKPDFSILKEAFNDLQSVLKDGDLVVLETTVPPGTTEAVLKPILDSSGKKYLLAFSPERIMTGQSIERYRTFPKVVGGLDAASAGKAQALYRMFCSQVVPVRDIRTAELVKVAEGVYRDVNIALANELFRVSERLGVNYQEMADAARHDFCNLLRPGNVGGHCIPVYPWFLINEYDVPTIRQARLANDAMIEYFAGKLPGKGRVLVYGLTYRPGVKELAYSRSVPMIRLLEKRGHEVYVYDPMLSGSEISAMGFRHTTDFEWMDWIVLMHCTGSQKAVLQKYKSKIVDTCGAFLSAE